MSRFLHAQEYAPFDAKQLNLALNTQNLDDYSNVYYNNMHYYKD